jgi:hypothetical protein
MISERGEDRLHVSQGVLLLAWEGVCDHGGRPGKHPLRGSWSRSR